MLQRLPLEEKELSQFLNNVTVVRRSKYRTVSAETYLRELRRLCAAIARHLKEDPMAHTYADLRHVQVAIEW